MTALPAADAAVRAGAPPRRIVSLVPSLTEALFAFGAGERVVGVTRFCEEPAALLAALPKVGGTKDPDRAAIVALRPELVVASSEENRAEDVAALRDAGLTVLVTHYPSVAAALAGLIELAGIVGAGAALASAWRDQARTLVTARNAAALRPVRYFCPIWRRPYMTARGDTYMADLLARAGGVDAAPSNGALHYNPIALDEVMAARPEIILLPDEPFRFQPRHAADFAAYTDAPAVAQQRIICFDGKLLTWYGPRIPAALRFFGELFDSIRAEAATKGASDA
jgi:ABC-type hemin transport system substrate-binding protein